MKKYRVYNKTKKKTIGYYNTLKGVIGLKSNYYAMWENYNCEIIIQQNYNGKWFPINEPPSGFDSENFELK